MTSARALFLDRDGVINEDHGYVHRPEDCDFLPGIFDLCRAAKSQKLMLVVVTNQAGIGRGLYTEADFERFTHWMKQRFSAEGAPLDRVYHCPFHPTEGLGAYRCESPRRKPNPGMLLQARDELGIDLSTSVLIGDRPSDVEAGLRAGVGTRLWLNRHPQVDTPMPAGAIEIRSLVDGMNFVGASTSSHSRQTH